MDRASQIEEVLREIVFKRPAIRTRTRDLTYAAREKLPDLEPPVKEREVENFLTLDPVKQIYTKKTQEWPSKNQMGEKEGDIWNADLLDLSKATVASDNAGFLYVLLVQSRFSRHLWARPVRRKEAGAANEPFLEILREARSEEPDGQKPPTALVTDKGGEFDNPSFQAVLRANNINWRLKGGEGDSRAALQNLSILDSAMGVYSRSLKVLQETNQTPGWHQWVQAAADDYNARSHDGRGMLGTTPNKAAGFGISEAKEKIINFNLKAAAAKGYQRGIDTQVAAKKKLQDKGAFRTMRKLEFEGKRQQKKRDPSWNAAVLPVEGFDGGYVISGGQRHLLGKVDPVDSRTAPLVGFETRSAGLKEEERAKLRRLGIVRLIETHLRSRGSDSIKNISQALKLTTDWFEEIAEIVGEKRARAPIQYVKLFPDIFHIRDEGGGQGGTISLTTDPKSKSEGLVARLEPVIRSVITAVRRRGGKAMMKDIHSDLQLLNPGSRLGKIVDKELGKKFANQKHLLYDLYPDRIKITGKPSAPYLELVGDGSGEGSGAASSKEGGK